ncbi:hypothetical protein ASD83_09055 [Devosia sp. Root685]|nr:hypothetical protein ASD83_09055 [Devosia sp. Root685]
MVLFAIQQLFEWRQARCFGRGLGFWLQLLGLGRLLSVPRHVVRMVDRLRALELVFRHRSILPASGVSRWPSQVEQDARECARMRKSRDADSGGRGEPGKDLGRP